MSKKLNLFVPIFVCFAFLISLFAPFINISEDISEKVLRLHILANSDSDYDQNLKLEVRDLILKETRNLFLQCKTLDDAICTANNNIDKITSIAESALDGEYSVSAMVTKEYFDTREYDNFTLPSGVYNSIKVIIGSGAGHNWWCVMFPQVCLSGCTDDLSDELTKDEFEFVTSNNCVVRFKVVEVYEKIKHKIIT